MTLQSAIYLQGNKRKLYQQIKPYLQDGKRKVLVDLFGGSGTMTLNCVNDNVFEKYVYNEKAEHLFKLQEWIKTFTTCDSEYVLWENNKYPKTKEGFLLMREDFNNSLEFSPATLYNLMCRSNSNMMRFNSNGNYNMTFGERHRCNVDLLWKHHYKMKDVDLWNKDFGDAIEDLLESGDLSGVTVYIDPPYNPTTAIYNENGGWTPNDNTTLLEYLLELRSKGALVVMSNVFENRGNVHQELIDFCDEHKDKFDVHHMNISYNNSSFRKGKGVTKEVLIVSK